MNRHHAEANPRGTGAPTKRGFTMIEVLAALAILAVLATTVLASRNRYLALASRNRARLAAVALASGLLDETLLASDPTALEQKGEANETVALAWSRRAVPYEHEALSGLFAVNIKVRYGADKDDEVRLSVITGTPTKGAEAAP